MQFPAEKSLMDKVWRGDLSPPPPPCRPQSKLNKASDVSILRITRKAGNYKRKRRGGQKLSSKISNTFSCLPSRERAPFQQARVCTA